MHRTARWDAQDSAWGAGSLCIRVFYEGKKENVISLAELPGANSYLRSMLRAFSDSARVGRTPGLSQARECWILALHFDRSLSQCSECVLSVRFRVICVQEGFKQAQYRPRVRRYRTCKSRDNGVRKRCPRLGCLPSPTTKHYPCELHTFCRMPKGDVLQFKSRSSATDLLRHNRRLVPQDCIVGIQQQPSSTWRNGDSKCGVRSVGEDSRDEDPVISC